MTFAIHHHLTHRLRLSGAKPLLPPCTFMVCETTFYLLFNLFLKEEGTKLKEMTEKAQLWS